jgi:small redox-active disulfide protein 2
MFEAFANTLAFDMLGLDPSSRTGAALHFFIMDVAKIFVLLVVVIYVMGLLRALVAPERVREFVRGRPDWQARGLAVSLGAVTPFCSCSSVPLFIGFVEAGIPLGVTFSFMIASPMINEVAAVILVGILGWKLAVLYVLAGLVVAWFGGIVMQRFRPERWVEDYVWKIQVGETDLPTPDTSLAGRHRYALAEVREILGRIWMWVLIGIGVGALFHGFVPAGWVTEHLGGDSWYTVPAAVVLGIPLYSNATGVIPVAEAMLGKGVAVGTTLALMMSVAALSLPEMLILDCVNSRSRFIMKQIKVLGSGCRNCEITANIIAQAAKDAGVEVEIEKVTDIAEIMAYGVMSTPGVVVDGRLVHAGGVPGPDQVRAWVQE